jgi:YD repeat-containing protein
MTMRILFTTAALLATLIAAQAEPQQVFRDASGRTIGTAQTNGNMTTFRDSSGNMTGTATTDSGGMTTFRDSRGSMTGTTMAPFRGMRPIIKGGR